MSDPRLGYIKLASYDELGSNGFGLQVWIKIPEDSRPPEKTLDDLSHATSELYRQLVRETRNTAPEAVAWARKERAALVDLFNEPIYVEDVPNEYDPMSNRPWLVVTTRVGHIKLGWRKRVISIDWSRTQYCQTSSELFADENVTKEKRLIHAWSLDKAREYICKIVESAS